MAISRMQQPMQMQGGLGALDAPRQNYFLGKLVKKATRAVKKVVKSPIGKAAIIGLGGAGLMGMGPLGGMLGGVGGSIGRGLGALRTGMFGIPQGAPGTGSTGLFGKLASGFGKMTTGQKIFTGLGATALAAPFLANAFGKDDEPEEVQEVMDVANVRNRARNFYSGQGDAGAGLAFMPKKKYVDQNFYAADGGRAGYADGMMVEDEEEEFIRSGAGQSRRQPMAFLAMGGDAGNAQAEQMLMAEFVKYKNKGGDLSFEQFVKAVMQQQDQSQGMEQPTMMAANGGRIGYAGGELVQDNMMMASSPSAGDDLNQSMEIFSIKIFGKELKDLTEDEYRDLEESLPDLISNSGEEQPMMAANGGMAGTSVPGYGTPAGTNQFGYPSGGVRVNAAEGGIMDTEEASEMIDMGGQEKDYRDEGGFVAMGGEERADDVPARLSKNEFVFTADAVRNAGGGDIDRGSEVMQNLMDNLEQGGQVSEDSQGLGGGEEMMMSEEMIEEPNGAQAMYEQQQALQSRMI